MTTKNATAHLQSFRRAYVQLPEGYFQLPDEEAAPFDEAIATAILEQLGISEEE